jgi:predicted CoA-binding protein
MAKASVEVVDRILNARSVAVVGASANPGNGLHVPRQHPEGGVRGKPLRDSIPGSGAFSAYQIYPSVMDIPGDIDLLVVCVPVDWSPM